MNRTLARVMPHVFRHEGGYVDHPADPGGATNMGITLATLSAWRGRPVGKADVRALTAAEATEIYRRQYWSPVRGDDLPAGVDYAVFDFAIHSGVRRASEYLQRAVGAEADGLIGVETLAAVRAAEPAALVQALCAARLRFLQRIRNRQTGARLWTHFGKGWQRRVEAVEAEAVRLAAAAGNAAPPDASVTGALTAWAAMLKAALAALLRGLFRAPA